MVKLVPRAGIAVLAVLLGFDATAEDPGAASVPSPIELRMRLMMLSDKPDDPALRQQVQALGAAYLEKGLRFLRWQVGDNDPIHTAPHRFPLPRPRG